MSSLPVPPIWYFHPVDSMRTKAHDPSHKTILTVINRQTRDGSCMGRMFGIEELQLCIGGRPVTKEEMDTLVDPLTDSVMHMCRMGPAFQEPINDDDTDEDDGLAEDKFEAIDTGDDASNAS